VPTLNDLLVKLHKVKRQNDGSFMACCPAHDDKLPSLHVSLKDDAILLKCFAGCSTDKIVQAVGIEMADLFLKPIATAPAQSPIIVTEYDYKDENGKILYQVVRYLPKSFRQRHRNGNNEWIWNMDGVKRVLYHLDELKRVTSETIYYTEGEKDADNLWNWGCIATTSPGGANSWRDEFADSLLGKRVVLIPHKDTAGLSYAKQIANSLTGKARELRVILLPGDKVKDVTDWLDAGGDAQELSQLEQDIEVLFASDKPAYRQIDSVVQWDKKIDSLLLTFKAEKISEERTGIHARVSIFGQHESLSWSYLNIERREDRSSLATAAHSTLKTDVQYAKDDMRKDLDSFCAGLWEFYLSRYVPEEMSGDETPKPLSFLLKPYVIESGGTIVFAPPGRGKSFTALIWLVSIDAGCQLLWPTQQRRVLFINLERSGESVKRRLGMVNRILGLPPTRRLLTLNARGKSLNDVMPACRKAILKYGIGLIALDSISRAGVGDLNENQSGNRVIDALSSLCPTWLALGHTSRATEDHMYGSVMQDAGADICVQLSSQVKEDGTLGIGWEITKQNDIGFYPQKIYALEFNEEGLKNFRPAKTFEFPNIAGKRPTDIMTTMIEFITNRDSGMATASEIAAEFGFDRSNVSRLLNQSGKFIETKKEGKAVYYSVKV